MDHTIYIFLSIMLLKHYLSSILRMCIDCLCWRVNVYSRNDSCFTINIMPKIRVYLCIWRFQNLRIFIISATDSVLVHRLSPYAVPSLKQLQFNNYLSVLLHSINDTPHKSKRPVLLHGPPHINTIRCHTHNFK